MSNDNDSTKHNSVLDNYIMEESCFSITENAKVKKYFKKFDKIISYLKEIHKIEDQSEKYEFQRIVYYLEKIHKSFNALSNKYLFSAEVKNYLPSHLEIDTTDSGFPNFKEFLEKETDKKNIDNKLLNLPSVETLKEDMVSYMLKYKSVPKDLQFQLSQKIYYENLRNNDMFSMKQIGELKFQKEENGVKYYIIDWAIYDTSRNLPNIYFMSFGYSGTENIEDETSYIYKEIKEYILNSSSSTLKMITIATGIDNQFENVHPKIIKRLNIGPMYSNLFTKHNELVENLLSNLEDWRNWMFSWTTEIIQSGRQETTKKGWFDQQVKEIFVIDKNDYESIENGITQINRNVIMPYEVYQKMSEIDLKNNPLETAQKYIVDKKDNITFI